MGGSDEKRRQKKLEKKRLKDDKRRAAASAAAAQAAVPQLPDRIRMQYPNPDALVTTGPLIFASWHVPPALAAALVAQGKSVPPQVNGMMLVDTGATTTCIADDVASDLGLNPIHIASTYGAGGLHQNPVYQAAIQIAITDATNGNTSVIAAELQPMAIPKLGQSLQNSGVMVNNAPVRVIGLLGRDFLRFTTLTYDGNKGLIEIRIHQGLMPLMPTTI